MATRLVRTDTIANIADFGAVAATDIDDDSDAATNAAAFSSALDSGARRIAIPEGIWAFEEIEYNNDPWLPAGVEIFGQGAPLTILRYYPTYTDSPVDEGVPAFRFFPGGNGSQSTIRDLTLYGPVEPAINTRPRGVGISYEGSLFNSVRDVVLWWFDVGVMFNRGITSPLTYAAHNTLERFQINACRTGIYMGDATNATVIDKGRVFYSLVQYDAESSGGAREEGVGIDIEGVYTDRPNGGQAIVISGVTMDSAKTCLRVTNSRDVFVSGCYFEPGSLTLIESPLSWPYGDERRRCIDIDNLSEGLTVNANLFSEPEVPFGEWNWTPTYVATPPEARGVDDSSSSPPVGGSYDVNGYGGALSGTTAAHVNKLKNGDMSRGGLFWGASLPAPIVTPTTSDYVTGGASLAIEVVSSVEERIYQDFWVDSGVRTVTVNVRYQLVTEGTQAFRIDLWDVASNTRLGFFSDPGPGPSDWRVRSLTGRFDGLTGGVVGPRQLRVRLFPYNGDAQDLDGQEVLIDSVWLVEGEYAATYRPYSEAVEVLAGNDREIFFSGTTTSTVGPVAAMPTNIPANAVAMAVEMRISADEATTHGGTLAVDDQQGSNPTTVVTAMLDDRVTTAEVTIPLTLGQSPAVLPLWTVEPNNGSNTVTYRARLKKWYLRP